MIRVITTSLIFVTTLGGFAKADPSFSFWQAQKSFTSITEYLKVEAIKRTHIRNKAIEEILTHRCHRYLFYSNIKNSCRKATQLLIEVLDNKNFLIADAFDPNQNKASINPVSFSLELRKLSKNPKVYSYLRAINSSLPSAYENFNFWTLTVEYAGSFEAAIEWLAVLFQDTSQEMIQVHYLESLPEYTNNKVLQAVRLELEKAIYNLQIENHKVRPSQKNKRSFLPPFKTNIHENVTSGYYHFYVSSYLAIKLKEKGISDELSAFIPFLFNYLYEIFTIPDFYSAVLVEPKNIQEKHKIKEIYMGYLGAKFALNPLNKTFDFKDFSILLIQDPKVLIYSIALAK